MSSMLAARPVATSISSARSSAGSLPSGPTIRQIPSLSAVTDAASKRAEVMTVMPRFVKLRSSELAHLAVLERHDLRQVLEHGDLHADVVEHRGELDADRARADDDDVLGQRVHLEDVVARHDALAVRVRPGQRLDPRAGRDDDVGRVQDAIAALAGRPVLAGLADPDLARAVQAAAALDPRDLVLVDEGLEPGPHPLHDGVPAGRHRRVVDDRLAGERQAVVLGVLDAVGERRRFEERLGRDAPAMEARPADLVLVDERDLQAELGGTERRGVPARARAEHDEIEVIGGADGHGSGCLG